MSFQSTTKVVGMIDIMHHKYDNVYCTFMAYSIYIGQLCVTSPAYADDLTINAISAKALQNLLDVVHKFSSKWRLLFNPSKCKIIIYGEDKTPHVSFKLGDEVIQRAPSHTHVGTVLSSSTQEVARYMKDRIKDCKKLTNAIHAIGSRRAPVLPRAHLKCTIVSVYQNYCMELRSWAYHLM